MNKEKHNDNREEVDTQNTLITIMAILVIMSGIQVFQTQKLLTAVSNGMVKTSTQTQGNPIGLPSQVGGCG